MIQNQIILCSASPRRQLLLKEMGFQFEVLKKDVDESFPPQLVREEIPCYLAEKKATAFREFMQPSKVFITADTIVWFNDKVLNKPQNENEAFKMLKELSGNMHEVYTGVTLFDSHHSKTFFVKSNVFFNEYNDDEIRFYIDNFTPFDKAGSYGAQECLPDDLDPISPYEAQFLNQIHKPHLGESIRHPLPAKHRLIAIKKIERSYFNVVGLPIAELYKELEEF